MYILTIQRTPSGYKTISRAVNSGLMLSKRVAYGAGLLFIVSDYPARIGAFVDPRKVIQCRL